MSTPNASATRISCLTPAGQAAIATLALRGPNAWPLVQRLFRPLKSASLPATPQPGRFWLGRLGDEMADEVVLAVKRTEPVAWLELHTHGGREVTNYLVDLFRSNGVEVCDWQDHLRRDSDDLLRAEAALALTAAQTPRTAAILLDQYHGAFTAALETIRQAGERGDNAAMVQGLTELVRYADLGGHLTTPWRIVIAGAPNVGKSSLVNALAGFERSIVSPLPGTTRDVVTTRIALDGWPVELADTAGLGDATEALEEQGIQQARRSLAEADLCLWVLDSSAELVWPDAAEGSMILVVNKVDVPPVWDLAKAEGALRVSARTGDGLAELCAAIAKRLVLEAPPPGAAVPFTPELADAIERACQLAREGQRPETLLAGSSLHALCCRVMLEAM